MSLLNAVCNNGVWVARVNSWHWWWKSIQWSSLQKSPTKLWATKMFPHTFSSGTTRLVGFLDSLAESDRGKFCYSGSRCWFWCDRHIFLYRHILWRWETLHGRNASWWRDSWSTDYMSVPGACKSATVWKLRIPTVEDLTLCVILFTIMGAAALRHNTRQLKPNFGWL